MLMFMMSLVYIFLCSKFYFWATEYYMPLPLDGVVAFVGSVSFMIFFLILFMSAVIWFLMFCNYFFNFFKFISPNKHCFSYFLLFRGRLVSLYNRSRLCFMLSLNPFKLVFDKTVGGLFYVGGGVKNFLLTIIRFYGNFYSSHPLIFTTIFSMFFMTVVGFCVYWGILHIVLDFSKAQSAAFTAHTSQIMGSVNSSSDTILSTLAENAHKASEEVAKKAVVDALVNRDVSGLVMEGIKRLAPGGPH